MSVISFCVLVIELVDGDSEGRPIDSLTYYSNVYHEMMSKGKGISTNPNQGNGDWKVVGQGQRKPHEVRISTYASVLGGSDPNKGPEKSEIKMPTEAKNFVSGNPFVEITKGILHLYKDNDRLYMEPGSKAARSEMLCVMAIPSTISCAEFLTYVASFKSSIEQIKIIRDNSPNHYMALLKFNDQTGADGFYLEFNGKAYNSFDDTICLVAYVSRVETVKQSDGGGFPISGHTELPTCPVCLERMDESVDGLLTILCNHSFHTSCLIQWSDNGCPVCRYVQTPDMVAKNACVECNSKDQLWICLICGHVGCGRYIHGHAFKHFCETEHAYAIQPDNNRVWDYIGDNFVHRLFQNKGDGKLVDTPSRRFDGEGQEDPEEKVDNMQLEFTHMLTSQLEAQRNYFEERLKHEEAEKKAEFGAILAKLDILESDKAAYEEKMREILQEKKNVEKKLAKTTGKYERTAEKLEEQLAVSKAMTEDLNFCKTRLAEVEKGYEQSRISTQREMEELKETIRDLSIYIQTEKVISESPFANEVSHGSVSVPEPPPKPTTSRGNRKKHGGK